MFGCHIGHLFIPVTMDIPFRPHSGCSKALRLYALHHVKIYAYILYVTNVCITNYAYPCHIVWSKADKDFLRKR